MSKLRDVCCDVSHIAMIHPNGFGLSPYFESLVDDNDHEK